MRVCASPLILFPFDVGVYNQQEKKDEEEEEE